MDTNMRGAKGPTPTVRILEQPASKALRFRYECEGRSAGSIPGVNSTPENKTYPTIKIDNYQGRAMVLVSCVTKDRPYRPHPHNLVGKEGCKRGVCTVEVNTETMTATFANLGIQCIKKKDIEEALRLREELRIDPFKTGFAHKNQTSTIDLNAVRLCFQVFLEGPKPNEFKRPIPSPVVSEPIYDKKAMSDLVIVKLSHCSATVAGGQEVILLCEKVAKEDIAVRLFEEQDGNIVWEGLCDFTPAQVHKQVAIFFRTPRYKTIDVNGTVQVSIQLLRPSDKATSEALPFLLTPIDAEIKRKRKKGSYSSNNQDMPVKSPINTQDMFKHLEETNHYLSMQPGSTTMDNAQQIKLEPNVFVNVSPIYNSPSPSPGDYGATTSGYNPPIYSQPPGSVHPVYSPTMHENMYVSQPSYSPNSPIQQVDVQMNTPGINQLLDSHQLSRMSPQDIKPINDLSSAQVQISRSPQSILLPMNDLSGSAVQLNQMSPQPQTHNVMQNQQQQQQSHVQQQASDELNTPTVSATGIEEHSIPGGNNYSDDSHPHMSDFNSDLAIILADMDTGALSQNLSSSLTFDDISKV
ncbi:putative transcription factor p65 homolog isoform X2 [Lycorma delicatula]|uniref:putative transcription factor p65 homolog isoform X2 n=1 Tax=Lycorma delicatula TaxID=130591 RepID=UPI003F518D46